jgi:hypothetical protein
MARLLASVLPLATLVLACCFGSVPGGAAVQVHGTVRDTDGAPVPNAVVVLIGNDVASCPDCTSQGTETRTSTLPDGSFSLANGAFTAGGYDGIVEVRDANDLVWGMYRFRPPEDRRVPIEVTLYVDRTPSGGSVDVDHATLEHDLRYRFQREEAEAGFSICSPRALHHCAGRRGEDAGERRWLAVDVDATTSCETLVADAHARCGPGATPTELTCLARAGFFADAASVPVSATPGPAGIAFTLHCVEGDATIAMD